MTIYDRIRARIDADEAYDRSRIDEDTIEGARAEIVKAIFEEADRWAWKAHDWDFQEQYCNQRAIVYEQILDILDESLWDDDDDCRRCGMPIA